MLNAALARQHYEDSFEAGMITEEVLTADIKLDLLGYVYADNDPMRKPTGHIFSVIDENGMAREMFVPLHVVTASTRKVYVCDIADSSYIFPNRSGLARSQFKLTGGAPSEAVKRNLRSFLNDQNTPEHNRKFLIIITG